MSKKNKDTILIIEDNEMNMALVREILKRDSSLLEATTGEEGIDLANKFLPDLILLDIGLPGIDGTVVAKTLKENPKTKGIPIIAVTAYVSEYDKERILNAGCDGHIPKPINVKTFENEIRTYLKKTLKMAQTSGSILISICNL